MYDAGYLLLERASTEIGQNAGSSDMPKLAVRQQMEANYLASHLPTRESNGQIPSTAGKRQSKTR